MTPFNGTLRDGMPAENVYTVSIDHPGGSMRSFSGWCSPVTWEFLEHPCLYVGNGQGGPIEEIVQGGWSI